MEKTWAQTKLLLKNSEPEGTIQQRTQIQAEDEPLEVYTCPIILDLEKARPTQEAPDDLSRSSDSFDVPPEFTTPPLELPENID